jgi:uncharacterized membrane protein HdeD (DUF308 family)
VAIRAGKANKTSFMNNMVSDLRQVARYWWIFLILGAVLIAFGILVFTNPADGYAGLTLYFELAFLLNGILEISFAVSNHRTLHGWGWHLAGGIFDLLVGVLLTANPVLAAVSLPYFAGFWLMFRSIAVIGRSFDLPTMKRPERLWMLVLGLAGLVFSFMILYNPVLGAFTLVTWTALALMAIGLFYIFLGLHFRKATDVHRTETLH